MFSWWESHDYPDPLTIRMWWVPRLLLAVFLVGSGKYWWLVALLAYALWERAWVARKRAEQVRYRRLADRIVDRLERERDAEEER